jgi:hypothetical protein
LVVVRYDVSIYVTIFCSDSFAAAIQANLLADLKIDGFGNTAFVAFMFILILVVFPIALMLLLLVQKQIISN